MDMLTRTQQLLRTSDRLMIVQSVTDERYRSVVASDAVHEMIRSALSRVR